MATWDTPAALRLSRVVADLRSARLVDDVQRLSTEVWRANLERYEPSELGDTSRWLGFSCWENLSQLLARHYTDVRASGESLVSASWPDGSLLLESCGVRLQVMKMPGLSTAPPQWRKFTWTQSESPSRHRAAQRNTAIYAPPASDQTDRTGSLDVAPLPFPERIDDPDNLKELILVWAGDWESRATVGWLGFPSLVGPPWFAVTELWQETDSVRAPIKAKSATAVVGFANRPEPRLDLSLKRRADADEQSQ